jgi:hypothetical protein
MTIQQVEKINKVVILGNVFSAIIFTSIMSYFTDGIASISWQLNQFSYLHPELSLILGGMIIRWLTLMENGKYDL